MMPELVLKLIQLVGWMASQAHASRSTSYQGENTLPIDNKEISLYNAHLL